MTKHLLFLFAVCLPLCSCGQSGKNNSQGGISIDPDIKAEVEKRISPSPFGSGQDLFQIYNNVYLGDFYQDNELKESFDENDKISSVFKSFYFWKGDTLDIEGAFGLFGGMGFTIKIVKGKATLYHMLASDDFPTYAYTKKDSLIFRLEVPCTDTKIILSELPDPIKHQIVYGYVEFKSSDYYTASGSFNEGEDIPRKKVRADMRIYFKSGWFDIGQFSK